MTLMDQRRTFHLALLFQETLLIAVVLACIRMLPREEDLLHTLTFLPYGQQVLLLTCIGTLLFAALGLLYGKTGRAALVGLCLSCPASILWTFYQFVGHALGPT